MAAEELLLDAVKLGWVVVAVVSERNVVAIRVNAVIVGEESQDIGVENLFRPATCFDESGVDIGMVESSKLLVVEEEGCLDRGEVDRVDKLVVNILQESPLEAVLLGVVEYPLVKTLRTGVIDLAVIKSKDGIEFSGLFEHVKVGSLDGYVRVDLLNVVEVVHDFLLPCTQDAEANHLKVSSGPGAVGAGRMDAFDARLGEIALAQKWQVRQLLEGEVRGH